MVQDMAQNMAQDSVQNMVQDMDQVMAPEQHQHTENAKTKTMQITTLDLHPA
jgi:hypothetical protein